MDACKKCGEVHHDGRSPLCKAHKKRTDPLKPCGRYPRKGDDFCYLHGGNLPNNRAKAERRRIEEALQADTEAFLATTGDAGVQDPLALLERVVAQNTALVLAAGQRLNAAGRLSHEDMKGGLHAKVELLAYERGLERAMRGADLLIRHRPSATNEAARGLLQSLADSLGLRPPSTPSDYDGADLL